jgi:pimeloyl-ACP methyl ester carboxylesterase
MKYSEIVSYLRERISTAPQSVSLPEIGIDFATQPFTSRFRELAPAGNEYQGLSSVFRALLKYYLARNESSNSYLFKNLEVADEQVEENLRFRYPLFLPRGNGRAKSVIVLLHGLNERSWDKYFPWAARLASGTGSAVILFPLSFHMNRAPASWSNPRLAIRIARERKELFPDLRSSSFANVAISTRLQMVPQRFCYSGLQSLRDIRDLASEVRRGAHRFIAPGARIDIFGYSIGGMIGEILLLADKEELFSDSRLLLFCSGSTLDLSHPVSRTILDSEAFNAVAGYYGADFRSRAENDKQLRETFSQHTEEAEIFSLMMNSTVNPQERLSCLRRIRARIASISLSQDTVMPPLSVLKSVNGSASPEPGLDVEMDFPFAYTHETPFPLLGHEYGAVNDAFERTFAVASEFLGAS